jgi:Tol biopolymer transport system component/DNA-binding winged helix-turn-helix (wHTH) protein
MMEGAFRIGEWRAQPQLNTLSRAGREVQIEPKAMQLLVYLAEHGGDVVSKEQLIRDVWEGAFVTDEVITYSIWEIRKALGDDAKKPRFIQTIPKKGYRLIAPVAYEGTSESDPAFHPEAPKQRRRLPVTLSLAVAASVILTYVLVRPSPETDQSAPTHGIFTQLTSQAGEELFPGLSPNGDIFVYASSSSGNWDIFMQRVGGENAMNLTADSSANDTHPAFSPDGKTIAFRSEREGGGIFLMGATGESVRRLTDFGHEPAWSPDGRRVVCATEGVTSPFNREVVSELWTIDVVTGERRILTEGDAVQPSWSPHGHRIAYWGVPFEGMQRDLWTMPATGGRASAITNDAYIDWDPVWSPDGDYIYFSSDRGGAMNLWRVPIEELSGEILGEPEPVTTGALTSRQHLNLSSDGRQLAYVERVETANIHAVSFNPLSEAIEGQPVPITRGSRTTRAPDLSPDGDWLAFGEQQRFISIIRKDGTGRRQLTDGLHKDVFPRWSPDGTRIAFYSDRGGNVQIWTIRPDGSGLSPVKGVSGEVVVSPVWAPDGSRMACFDFRDMGAHIYQLGQAEQIMEALPPFGGADEYFNPFSWSADGKTMAGEISNDAGAYVGIATYSLATREYRRLTDFGRGPEWLSDNRRLLFVDSGRFFLLDTVSRRIQQILSSPDIFVGNILSLSHDDRNIYFPRRGIEADIWLLTFDDQGSND